MDWNMMAANVDRAPLNHPITVLAILSAGIAASAWLASIYLLYAFCRTESLAGIQIVIPPRALSERGAKLRLQWLCTMAGWIVAAIVASALTALASRIE